MQIFLSSVNMFTDQHPNLEALKLTLKLTLFCYDCMCKFPFIAEYFRIDSVQKVSSQVERIDYVS